MGSPLQAIMSLLQAPRPKPPVTVRPDYGLTGAQVLQPQRSPYERTMRPGETRSPDELQDMLAEVILAAGGAVVPGVGSGGGGGMVRASRTRPTRTGPPPAEWFRTGEGESPVPTGKVRIYNGGNTQWFSSSREVAEQFAHEASLAGRGGKIRYLDVTPGQARQYFEASQRTGASIPSEDAMVVPTKIAATANPLFTWSKRDYK